MHPALQTRILGNPQRELHLWFWKITKIKKIQIESCNICTQCWCDNCVWFIVNLRKIYIILSRKKSWPRSIVGYIYLCEVGYKLASSACQEISSGRYKFDFRLVDGFLQALLFPPSIKLTRVNVTELLLKLALKTPKHNRALKWICIWMYWGNHS